MPAAKPSSITALALHEQPDGRWSVHVSYSDDTSDLTIHDDEPAARARALDVFVTVPTNA